MNHSRRHDDRLDPGTAERLLRGQWTAEQDGRVADLARLLSLASERPGGRPEDETAALALFRGRSEVHRGLRARLAKVTIGGFTAVFLLSGVAIAAGTGVLPQPFGFGADVPWRGHPGPPAPGAAGSGHHWHRTGQAVPEGVATPPAPVRPPNGVRPPARPAQPPGPPIAGGKGVHIPPGRAVHGALPSVLPSLPSLPIPPGHASNGGPGPEKKEGQANEDGAQGSDEDHPDHDRSADGGSWQGHHGKGTGKPAELPGSGAAPLSDSGVRVLPAPGLSPGSVSGGRDGGPVG